MATVQYEKGDDFLSVVLTREEQIVAMRLLGKRTDALDTFITDWLRQRYAEVVTQDKRDIAERVANATDIERAAIKLALGLF